MGPCDRTSTWCTSNPTGPTPPTKPRRIGRNVKICSRTSQKRNHSRIVEPLRCQLLLHKEKGLKLRPIQDYRPINKWTKKNRNVSPLIPQTIDRLSSCTLFTKFNVRWGYNNVGIKKGDEWKAAFLTPEGLFEPTVMFFGLTKDRKSVV